ncbi:hypothetical protein L596_023965 [Steinernema carpocapsae]|uniref:LIM zinc-binding domain-containing protein n=1 Tax=Steinernema carpocapsae TaxID=34508 RepID=A0A4V5ZZK6_STECR|nr:hypothetical protein L596_023965 [Steinernema carpocapsae]
MSKKGRCPHCEKPIGLQQAIFANGNLWHVEHFICILCSVAIVANEVFHIINFVETLMPIANDLLQNSFGKPLDEAEQEHQWIPHVVRKLNV